MAEHGVIVDDEMAVGGVNTAVLGQDQRIDLGRAGVVFAGRLEQLGQKIGHLHHRRSAEPRLADKVAGFEFAQPVRDIDGQAGDLFGMVLGDLFDAGSAHRAEDEERALAGVVHDQAGEEFRADGQLFLDQDAVDDVVFDLPAEERLGFLEGLLGRLGELDAAHSGPAGQPDLHLEDDGLADLGGKGFGFIQP